MSAGDFTRAIYVTDLGNSVNIRVQPETLDMVLAGGANASGPGPLSAGFPSATSSRSPRAAGINARVVTFQWDAGQAPAGYSGDPISNLPIMSDTVFDNSPIGSAATYLGGTGVIVGRRGEVIR